MDVKKITLAILQGCFDSFRGMIAVSYMDQVMNERHSTPVHGTPHKERDGTSVLKKYEGSKVRRRIIQCCLLNGGIFLCSIFLFEYGLLPAVNWILHFIFGKNSFIGRVTWAWVEPLLSFIFKSLWVVPLFLLCKAVNSLWFQDIADSAYRYSRGRPSSMQDLGKWVADSIFSIVIQSLFLIQAIAVNYLPVNSLGHVLSLVHMCLLYSLYAFEYKWFNMGWELHRRLTYIENNWPYFLGFGLPLTLVTQFWQSWIISGCIFSILFPFFIVSGNEANPVTDTCAYPLHLFSPVIGLSNALFSKTIGGTDRANLS